MYLKIVRTLKEVKYYNINILLEQERETNKRLDNDLLEKDNNLLNRLINDLLEKDINQYIK